MCIPEVHFAAVMRRVNVNERIRDWTMSFLPVNMCFIVLVPRLMHSWRACRAVVLLVGDWVHFWLNGWLW